MAVFEVLEMSSEIEKIVLDNPVDSRIWAAARAQGMLTMQEDAMLKAFDKRIPFSEVLAGDAQQEAPVVEKVPDETTEATTA
jgi:type II secretory ATPase GspE/PulE/Tfp pilus assembly ATPase PilB-like protein